MKRNPASRRRYTPTRLFDKFNYLWDNYNRKNNAIFLGKVLGELNDLLRERGYVTLNEVFQRLGFGDTKTSEGDFEGWVYEPHPKYGDGYITFGIWDQGFANGMDWINGRCDLIKLRFNIDRVPLCVSMQLKREWEEEQ